MRTQSSCLLAVLLSAMNPLLVCEADEPSESSESVKQVHAALSNYDAQLVGASAATEVTLSPRPLLTFGDAARNNEGGSLWVWAAGQRPLAFIEVYRPGGNDPNWIHAITLASEQRLDLKLSDSQSWRPAKSQRQPKRCPDDVAAVADSPVQRLRQMKDISRHLSAHEFWDPNNSRFELRLLVQPMYRYQDEAAKIVDASVFALAHGTNPEVLVFIEAIRENGTPAWHYDFIRLGSAEMHVLWDDKEIWTAPRTPGVVGQPTDPYWIAVLRDPTRNPN